MRKSLQKMAGEVFEAEKRTGIKTLCYYGIGNGMIPPVWDG